MRFQTILADPPWSYGDKLRKMKTAGGGAEQHYPCLSLTQIAALSSRFVDHKIDRSISLTIAGHRIADDAHLWLWITNPFLVNEPWIDIVRAWDFEPKTLVTWVKGRLASGATQSQPKGARLVPHLTQGHYTRGCTEHLILATRGKAKALVQAHNVPNVFIAPRTRHSEKPEQSYALIERVSPGPRLELFARKPREGWIVWGNEVA